MTIDPLINTHDCDYIGFGDYYRNGLRENFSNVLVIQKNKLTIHPVSG